jgi:hypothetical protein
MEFSLKQLSWVVIGAIAIAGSGYVSVTSKIEEIDKRLSVVCSQMEQQTKQLDLIEIKLNTTKDK